VEPEPHCHSIRLYWLLMLNPNPHCFKTIRKATACGSKEPVQPVLQPFHQLRISQLTSYKFCHLLRSFLPTISCSNYCFSNCICLSTVSWNKLHYCINDFFSNGLKTLTTTVYSIHQSRNVNWKSGQPDIWPDNLAFFVSSIRPDTGFDLLDTDGYQKLKIAGYPAKFF
jgi:hypothetical protein